MREEYDGIAFERAKLIGLRGENEENTWLCYKKSFEWRENSGIRPMARIAADSKYWLYLNGKLVVREGGLKRGPSPKDTYFDEVDLGEYLIDGVNCIAILVWYFGRNGFSHVSSGQAGLMFSMPLSDDEFLVSDESFSVRKHDAFVKPDPEDPPTNFRLSEANLYYDAARDQGEWYTAESGDASWKSADAFDKSVWGKLIRREIPQLKDFGISKYLNAGECNEVYTDEDTVFAMRLPYNAQFLPILDITAPEGKKITIRTENYNVGMYEEKCAMAVYYTREGHQTFECYGWLNGEWAYYMIPAGVTVHSLGYRETGYNTEFVGSFKCDDEFLNRLWEKSLRTLYVTMRDTFMDCPDRERVQWWGDVSIEMQMARYCLDERALLLYKKGVDSLVGWAEHAGHMMTVVPSGTEQFELPMQNLAGIWGFYYYYEYTGDISVPARAYEMSKGYLKLFEMAKDGLVEHRTGSWDWPDWGDNADIKVMENAWYYMALQSCLNMAVLLEKEEDVPFYRERMTSIKEHFDAVCLKGDHYYYATANGLPDDRANALAVLSGLAGRDVYAGILKILQSTENSSPYMEKYVLDALCEMGYVEEAIVRMKRRYREMVETDYSTLWEFWDKAAGTMNHAWSGGPLITMAKYIAGIRPADIGYKKLEIKPCLCNLKYVSCRVSSARGEINFESYSDFAKK